MTPVAKRGLGRHFTFDFLAPSFEEHKKGDDLRKDASFYGDVKFDFKQFGEDSSLKKSPLHYCLKVCHKIGFYLQKLYKVDLMRIHVDFYQDEFKKIWLMQADKIFIREKRVVPIEGKNLLANYILR